MVILLEKNSTNSPSAIENKKILDVAVYIVFDIHKKSFNKFRELLNYLGLDNKQIDSFIDTCLKK